MLQLAVFKQLGIGGEGRNRTDECSFCRAVPYHLATPPSISSKLSSLADQQQVEVYVQSLFFRKSQPQPSQPKFSRLEYSDGCDDAGDQFRRRQVKSRIAGATCRIGYADVF